MERIITNMNLSENDYNSINNKKVYIRKINNNVYSYDFVFKDKIIEFNGDYWHCNPIKYTENYFHKHRQLTAKQIWEYDKLKKENSESIGFKVLTIWENDYKQNDEKVIKECIEFLKKINK